MKQDPQEVIMVHDDNVIEFLDHSETRDAQVREMVSDSDRFYEADSLPIKKQVGAENPPLLKTHAKVDHQNQKMKFHHLGMEDDLSDDR
jgi:hypothetical protein